MERKITFEVRDNDKVVWPDFEDDEYTGPLCVCADNDAGKCLARFINVQDENILYLSHNEYNLFQELADTLRKYWEKDLKAVQRAEDMLEDLREARRHSTHEDFFKFSDSMERTEKWIEENNYSAAHDLYEYLNKAYYKMIDFVNEDDNEDRQAVFNRYRVAIILGE